MRSLVKRGQDTVTMFKVAGDLCSEASIDRTPAAGEGPAFAQSPCFQIWRKFQSPLQSFGQFELGSCKDAGVSWKGRAFRKFRRHKMDCRSFVCEGSRRKKYCKSW